MEPDLEAGFLSTSQSPAVAEIKQGRGYLCVHLTIYVVTVAAALAFIAVYPSDTLLPTFSLDVAGFDGLGGGGAGVGPAGTTVNATFDLTLHGVTRRRQFGRTQGICCQERGTVAVSYAGAVLAWSRVPRFCVPAQGQEHVRMVALGADVELTGELRGRLAAERLARTAELDVDITLDRWRYLSCRVKLDETSTKPSPCKVFAVR